LTNDPAGTSNELQFALDMAERFTLPNLIPAPFVLEAFEVYL